MELTLSVDDEIVELARERAKAFGKTLEEMVLEHVEGLAGRSKVDMQAVADEFDRLSEISGGDSRGWEWNREELHERNPKD